MGGRIMNKQCTKCKEVKSASEFYKSKNHKTGLSSWCKKCQRDSNKRYLKTDNGKKKREEYKNTDAYKESQNKHDKLEHRRVKKNLRQRTRNHVNYGNIQKPTHCEVCGLKKDLEIHHLDYKTDFNIIFVCKDCHHSIHNQEHD